MSRAHARRFHLEEIANSITHGVGLLLSIAGLVALVILAAKKGSAWHVVSVSVYGATLVLLYAASTAYHAARSRRWKHFFRIVDHSSIYLLIAGTYTPFTLVNLRGPWGWTLFGLVWGLAAAGILFKIWFVDHFAFLSTAVYLAMGWMAVIAIRPVFAAVPSGGRLWLLAGGLSYTIGVAFFAWNKLPYNHTIWHLFVLGGSVSHFFAVMYYVLPARA